MWGYIGSGEFGRAIGEISLTDKPTVKMSAAGLDGLRGALSAVAPYRAHVDISHVSLAACRQLLHGSHLPDNSGGMEMETGIRRGSKAQIVAWIACVYFQTSPHVYYAMVSPTSQLPQLYPTTPF